MRDVRSITDPPADLDFGALRDAVAVDEVDLADVFGSSATGDQGPLSDLDVALLFREDVPKERRLELLDELTVAIIDATGIEAVDRLDLDTVGPRIGYEILAKGSVVVGDEQTATDLEVRFLVRKLDFQPVKRPWDDALDERIRNDTYGRP